MRKRQSFLGSVASNAARRRTISAETAVYQALWGTTPAKDRGKVKRKSQKNKTFLDI